MAVAGKSVSAYFTDRPQSGEWAYSEHTCLVIKTVPKMPQEIEPQERLYVVFWTDARNLMR